MDIDKDLTVLLTLFDRPNFTSRWMSYANKILFPFKVLIADGGKDKSVEELLSNPTSFPNVNFKYLRYPYDKDRTTFNAKVDDALSKVDTRFVVRADDDDFYFVDSLRESIQFLSDNPNYGICRGRIGKFVIGPEPNRTFGENVEFILEAFVGSNEQETAAKRVERNFSQYDTTHYDVHRTKDMQQYYKILKDLDMKNASLAELLPSSLAVIDRPSKINTSLYLMRQLNIGGSVASREKRNFGDYFDRMLIESWSGEFSKFSNTVAKKISEMDVIQKNEALALVKKGFRAFAAPILVANLSPEKKSLFSTVRRFIFNMDKDSLIRKTTRRMWHCFQDSSDNISRPRPIYPSSPYFKDILPILNYLTNRNGDR